MKVWPSERETYIYDFKYSSYNQYKPLLNYQLKNDAQICNDS